VVDLSEHVPARWLEGRADRMPLTPERIRRRMPRRCRTRGGYREHCQGERRVPEPHGPAAELARRLALGQRAAAMLLRHGAPIDAWAEVAADTDPNTELVWPVPGGVLGRGYGRVRRGELSHRRHFGIDIGADEAADIVAARGGLVAYSDDGLTGYGNSVMVLHADGFTTFYAHCYETLVFAGQKVERGQVIARVGQTGFARAPHLHFEWRQRGWARDPLPQMEDERYHPRGD